MFLTIFLIIACSAVVFFILLKWKGSISLIMLGLCLAATVLLIYLNTGEKKKDIAQKKIGAMNLIEYVDYMKKNNNSPELKVAVTTAHLNLRDRAGRDGERILSIPKGTHISVASGDHDNGWFNVIYDGRSGWVYGKYLQGNYKPIIHLAQVQPGSSGFLVYLFPEQTWWGMILGLIIGISISLYLALMGNYDMLAAKRFGISWAYFMIKNIYVFIENYPHMISSGTLLAMLIASAVLTFAANALSNISLNIIDQHRFKAVSH